MRILSFILPVMLPAIVLASSTDSLTYNHGAMVEFNGIAIDQIGYRYRVTEESRFAIRLHVEYRKYENVNSSINNSKETLYSATFGYERDIYSIGSASLFVSCGLELGGSVSESYTYSVHPPPDTYLEKRTGSFIGGIFGLGIEYSVTRQLSIFAHQDIEWVNSVYTTDPKDNSSMTGRTAFDLVNTRIGLTIYL